MSKIELIMYGHFQEINRSYDRSVRSLVDIFNKLIVVITYLGLNDCLDVNVCLICCVSYMFVRLSCPVLSCLSLCTCLSVCNCVYMYVNK